MNDIVTYPNIPVWNDFQVILFSVAVRIIYVFRSPLPYFFLFLRSPFFVFSMYRKGGGGRKYINIPNVNTE
jgi:hypothetical protein